MVRQYQLIAPTFFPSIRELGDELNQLPWKSLTSLQDSDEPLNGRARAAHMGGMNTSFACAPIEAPRYRATHIQGEDDLARIARDHGVWYGIDQAIERYASTDPGSPDRMRLEAFQVRGAYLVERLHPSGAPIRGGFEVLSPEVFAARYRPLLHLAAAA